MDQLRGTLLFLQLLSLTCCANIYKAFLSKSIGSGADITPICKNETDNLIRNIYCKIEKRGRGIEACGLGFMEKVFINNCGSRIKLFARNQTVFLELKGLTPEDSGIYSCECSTITSYSDLYINITVEDIHVPSKEEEQTSESRSSFFWIIICSALLSSILVILVTVVCVCKRRRRSRPALTGGEETYATLQSPHTDMYEIIVHKPPAPVSGPRPPRSHRRPEYENVKKSAHRTHVSRV